MSIYFSRNYNRVGSTDASYTHMEVEINIYYGTQTTDRATGTTLNLKTKRVSNVGEFNIGPYIKDFIKPVFNATLSSITNGACWVDYRTRSYTPGGATASWSAYVQREYSLGYTIPGGTGLTTQQLLMDYTAGQRFLKPSTELMTVPLNRNNWSSNTFTGDGTQSPGYVGTTTDSDAIISYLTANKTTYTAFGALEIESVPYNTNHKITPTKIAFINRFGAYQELWFMGGRQETLNVTGQKYDRATRTSSGLWDNDHQVVDYGKNGRISVTLNSGWQPEANNTWFEQLLMSESVYIYGDILNGHYTEDAYSARVNQNSIVFKTRERDRLINYTISFDYTFDVIQR